MSAINSNSSNSGGWANTTLRTYLRETVLSALPEAVRSNIKEVTKTYLSKSPTDETLTIADTIWIPSYREVGLTSSANIESSGPVYSAMSPEYRRRRYLPSGKAQTWWLRSASGSYGFSAINNSGVQTTLTNPSTEEGVVFGFCL